MLDTCDVVVIGAGVIGLAIAREAASRGHQTLVVDSNLGPGQGISSRNSEVIHAGVYYPVGSLKAFHCIRGRRMLYNYCLKKSVPFCKTGKLIVATDSAENIILANIAARSAKNGVVGEDALTFLTGSEARSLEPALFCTSALLSPSSGIIDSHCYMTHLMMDAGTNGADFSFGTSVDTIEPGSLHRVAGSSHGERFEINARHVFVAAGLHTAALCRNAGLSTPDDYWLKGNYFTLNRPAPFSRLIYPVPVKGGLGVHVTLDMCGQIRFGPDTQAVETENYDVDLMRVNEFESSIRRYWPGLPAGSLSPAYSGIRPKLFNTSGNDADFVIDGPEQLGIDGFVALHGIDSPGLTSSLSLGIAACDKMFNCLQGSTI